MPKKLTMPTTSDLPEGPWRTFVMELFVYYRAARRPDLRKIAEAVDAVDEEIKPGTASRETIRQMFHGSTVPHQWGTAAVVLIALCNLAEIDPYDPRDGFGGWGDGISHLDAFEQLWNDASDVQRPPTALERAKQRRLAEARARLKSVERAAQRP